VASSYDKLLRGTSDIRRPQVAAGREHVYHFYVIRAEQRDALRQYLTNAGVTTVLNYPKALPFYPAYAHLNHTP
jgi:dTDP-4-amino-4,6-dideoxygalactose transaminase